MDVMPVSSTSTWLALDEDGRSISGEILLWLFLPKSSGPDPIGLIRRRSFLQSLGSLLVRLRLPFDTLWLTSDLRLLRAVLTFPQMALRDWNAREILLVFVGSAITALVIMTCTRFYFHEYRKGILFLVLAVALAFVFFRKRKILLAIISLSWVLVNAGLTAPFHPSVFGYALTIGSAAGLYFIARWSYKRYPYLSYKNRRIMFDGEAAMDAENARLQAKAREFVKTHPHGPWLFR